MQEDESLWRRAQEYFEKLLALEADLTKIARTAANDPAARLICWIDRLKPFGVIFKDFAPGQEQPDIGPLVDVLRKAQDDLPGEHGSSALFEADEWQGVLLCLQALCEEINAVCEHSGSDPLAEVAEPVDAATSPESTVIEVVEPVETKTVPQLNEQSPSAPPVEDQSAHLDAAQVAAEAAAPVEPTVKSAPDLSDQDSLDLLPLVAGPAVYFLIKTAVESENNQKAFGLIKILIDEALPIMGETGKDFSYSLDLNLDKSFKVVAAKGDQELNQTLGLSVTLEDNLIILQGQPPAGFDGPLSFSFAHFDHIQTPQTHAKAMYIAADPRTLWQDLPVEDFEGYPADNEACEARQLLETDKIVVAASCRGRSHAHTGRPRDDNFLIDADEESGWNFVAVADGAGSCRFSRKGSALACASMLATLKQLLPSDRMSEFFQANQDCLHEWKREFEAADGCIDPALEEKHHQRMAENSGLCLDGVIYNAIYTAYNSIVDEAKSRVQEVRDYHTTLICAAFKQFDFGWFIISYWVGDGVMALYNWNQSGRVLVPGIPDSGEFAGQTRFLTMGKEEINPEAVARRTRYTFAKDFESMILATDGITDAFFPSEKSVLDEDEWRNFWSQTLPVGSADAPPCKELFDGKSSPDEQALALRRWLDFWSKGNHDDRSILIVK